MPRIRMKSLVVSPDSAPSNPTDSVTDDSSFLPVQDYPTQSDRSITSNEVDLPVDTSPLTDSYRVSSDKNPDEAARVVRYTNKLSEDPNYVRGNITDIERADKAPAHSLFGELERDYPGSTKFLTDPQNMSVTHDDIPNVAVHEKLIKGIGNAFNSINQSAQSALLQEEQGFLAYEQNFPQDIAGASGPRLGKSFADSWGFSKDPATRAEQIRATLENLQKTQASGITGAPGDLAVNLFVQGLSGFAYGLKYGAPAAAYGAATGFATAGLSTVPTALAGLAAGETVGQLEYNYKMMAGLQYDRLSRIKDSSGNALPDEVVKNLSVINAAAISGLSLVKLNALVKAIPGGSKLMAKFTEETSQQVLENAITRSEALQSFAKRILDSAVHGGTAFGLITAANIGTEEAANQIAGLEHRTATEAGKEILTSAVQGAAGTALLGVPLSSAGLIADVHQSKRVESAKQFMTALGDTAEGSKLRERMPEKHKQLVAELTKDGPVETVYVPKEAFDKYFQSKGITPDVVAEELGVSGSYQESKATGGNVEIPLANWTEKLVGTEHHAGLIEDIKFHQDDLTGNQLKEAKELVKKQTEAQSKDTVEQPQQEPTPREKIEADVHSKAKAAGRNDAESIHNAKLHGAYFATLGDVLGVDPHELYQKYDLQIREGKRTPLEPSLLAQDPTDPFGTFSINPETRKSTIDLLEKANKSTLLHESGHLFLEASKDAFKILDQNGELNDKQKAFIENSKKLLEWLGVSSFDEVKTEHHEKFARGFEQYLREGKAPTSELQKTFSAFKRWLTKIYRNAEDLGIKLNPDAREIFSRMLSTQEELDAAEAEVAYKKAEVANAAPEAAKSITELQELARSKAEEALLKEQIPETTEEHKKFLVKEEARIKELAEKQVKETVPVFIASEYLKEGLRTRKPLDEMANKFLDGKLKDDQIALFESAAELNGFADGEDLAKNIIIAEKNNLYNIEVKRLVNDGMSQYADMMTTDKIRESAMEKVHSEKMTELLALEAQVLSRLVSKDPEMRKDLSSRRKSEARTLAVAAKEQAKKTLDSKPAKEAGNFRKYITAEREAAQRVTKALAKGDMEAAAKAKQEQMINHALVSQAMKNKLEANKTIEYLKDTGKRKSDLKDAPYGYIRQADALTASIGLSSRNAEDIISMQRIASEMHARGESEGDIANVTGQVIGDNGQWRAESLRDFVVRVNKDFYAINLPESVYSTDGVNYADMPMSQLRDVKDTVKMITQLGRKHNGFLTVADKADMKVEAIKFRDRIKSELGEKYASRLMIGTADEPYLGMAVTQITSLSDKAIPQMVNLLTICRYLDMRWDKEQRKYIEDPDGPAKNYIYRVLENAENKKIQRMDKVRDELNSLIEKHYTADEFSALSTNKEPHPELGVDASGKLRILTREELISIALNWGTESSRDRIRAGYRLNDSQVESLIGKLSKKEMDFVQDVWDYIDKFWPESVELQMRVEGTEAKKLEAKEIQTEHGSYRGGYFPLVYDPEKSVGALKTAEEKSLEYKNNSVARAQTDQSRLQGRVSNLSRPVKLSLSTLFNALEDTVHDLSYREPLIDVNSFLRHKEVSDAITGVIGVDGYRAIEKMIDNVAGRTPDDFNLADKFVTVLKGKMTPMVLGFRIASLPTDFIGNLGNAAKRVGALEIPGMMSDFLTNREHNVEFVENSSAMMRNRSLFIDKDLGSIQNKWQGKESAWKMYLYWTQVKGDEAVSYPMWMKIYNDHLTQYGHDKAVNIADEAIKSSFGSGSPLDQVGAQRLTGVKGIFSSFYSWQSMMFNQAWLDGKISGLEYNKGNTGNAIRVMATSAMYLWGYQALQENLVKEALRNNKGDDPEAKKRRILARTLQQPLGYVWIARDIGGYLIEKNIAKQQGANYRLSPIEQSFETLVKPLSDKEFNVDHVIDSAAMVTGTPAQITTWAHNYIDWLKGNGDVTWRDLINRRTKK